jgi:hypothetical protein
VAIADPAGHVHDGVELLVSIIEPRLAPRGSLIGARVTSDAPEHMSTDEARRLASALGRAADMADEADRRLLPILESYAETRDAILQRDA